MFPTRVRAIIWASLLLAAHSAPVGAQFDDAIREVTVVETTYSTIAGHNILNMVVRVEDRTLAADFLDFYRRAGGVGRWGLPISEIFEEEVGRLTQYFQRGVIDWQVGQDGVPTISPRPSWDLIQARISAPGDPEAESNLSNPFATSTVGPWLRSVSDRSIGGVWTGFAEFIVQIGGLDTLGWPKSEARRDDRPDVVFQIPGTSPGFVRQYFQNAVLKWHPGRTPAVKLALIGPVLRKLMYPDDSWQTLSQFNATKPLSIGDVFAPNRVVEIAADGEVVRTAQSFTFTAAGDFGANADARRTLAGIAAARPEFHLALGDLSYGLSRSEERWCDLIKSHVGADFPFQLVPGNHDLESGAQIGRFARCLPNRMSASVGRYPSAYYFDYNGLARVITIAPDLRIDGRRHAYRFGDPDYEWLRDAVDAARTAGTPWVIVAMHKNCLSAGPKRCEIGGDLLNLLVAQRVDLILQGHDHSYQRSFQLALSSECPLMFAERFNPACIANTASASDFNAGGGAMFVIAGTGGRPLYGIDFSDADRGYFAEARGAGSGGSRGFARFVVSATEIRGEYVVVPSGGVRDAFVIRRAAQVNGVAAGDTAIDRAARTVRAPT